MPKRFSQTLRTVFTDAEETQQFPVFVFQIFKNRRDERVGRNLFDFKGTYLHEISQFENSEELQIQDAENLSMPELEKVVKKRAGKPIIREQVARRSYIRDSYISEYVKRRANGKCQLCGQNAPFHDKKGRPYLESHHIIWLSKGGLDSVENMVALCPNCHRKMHVLDKAEDVLFLQNLAH